MTTFLQSQHEARKARLQRFAEAAARLSTPGRHSPPNVMPSIAVSHVKDEPSAVVDERRREYETPIRSSAYTPVTLRILRAVADEFGMTIDDIRAQNREKQFTVPRFVAIGLMIEMTRLSLPAIGRQLGGRDHTTIINGRRRIEALLAEEAFRNRFDQIKASIIA